MTEQAGDVTEDMLLLYELALSVGRSLDVRENCRDFLSVLTARKNVAFAAIWLVQPPTGAQAPSVATLVHAVPDARARDRELPAAHPLFAVAHPTGYFATTSARPDYEALAVEADTETGSAAMLALGDLGVVKLYRDGTDGFTDRELRQLRPVTAKLAVALSGALAHQRVVHESVQRRRAEQEREILERGLRQAQKMEALGQVAAGVAHDFNNLLAAILGFAQLAQMRFAPASGPKLGEYLAEIRQAGDRGRELVAQLLTFSRGETTERHVIAIGEVLDESLHLIRSVLPAGVLVAYDSPGSRARVLGNATQIRQAVLNLCINARDAMGQHGQLDFAVARNRQVAGLCGSCLERVDGPYVTLTISDTGPGIPPDIRARIFDPFFTTRGPDAGGMGLSVVHGIVHGHGGHVLVDENDHRGVRVTLLFPPPPAPGGGETDAGADAQATRA